MISFFCARSSSRRSSGLSITKKTQGLGSPLKCIIKNVLGLFFIATALTSMQAIAQLPEPPAFVRDTHLVDDGEFTRPFQPTVHTSLDGRIALDISGTNRIRFDLFTPERLNEPFTTSAPDTGTNNVIARNEFTMSTRPFLPNGVRGLRHIALCEAPPTNSASNPRVCNSQDDCYDLTVISAGRAANGGITFVGSDITVRVENPKTPQASIADIQVEDPVIGSNFPFNDFFETTTPADGRILIGRTARSSLRWVDGDGNDRTTSSRRVESVYLINDNPDSFDACDVRQFNKVYPLSYAPYHSVVNTRYGFAMHPFRDPSGNVLPEEVFMGSYPWIDREARNVSVTALSGRLFSRTTGNPPYPARCPTNVERIYGSCLSDSDSDINSAKLQGRVIMGLWTNGKMVQFDNVINNMDFGLGTEERRHRELQLYSAGPNHDGWVQVGGGRNGNDSRGGPRPDGSRNVNLFDSTEHRFNMFENMKPVTPSDVPWIVSKGVVSDELIFDDYNNPDSFINAAMVPATRFVGRDFFYSQLVGSRSAISNDATALPDRWSIPDLGTVRNGDAQRVANGGIRGRGLWLNPNTSVEFNIPNNRRDIDASPWYVGLFFDRRFTGDARNLVRFSDGTSLRVTGAGGFQFVDQSDNVVAEVSVPNAVQSRSRPGDRGWAHVGLNIEPGNQTIAVYYNGFYLDQVQASQPLFRMAEGTLYLGDAASNSVDGFRGWIDDFKVFAQNVNQEVACNHANGTLIGTVPPSGWYNLAGAYPEGHDTIRGLVSAAGDETQERYACFHDYSGDYAANIRNIPPRQVSIREAINFPEGPLLFNAPRPDSSSNAFCLSCHTSESKGGLSIAAITLNPSLLAQDDPRRQPTQPDAKVFGFIPANWLGNGKPARDIATGVQGVSIDQWLLADANTASTPTQAPTPNQAPEASFASPQDGQVFDTGESLTVVVNASDNDGSIDNVRLFLNGSLVRQENLDPYEWGAAGQNDPALDNLSEGDYVLRAVATDDDGETTETTIRVSVVSPVVNQAPVVSFARPRDGRVFNTGQNLTVVANASDSDGSIDNVRLFLNGSLVRQENFDPYEWGAAGQNDPALDNLSEGEYVLRAVATDNDGQTSETSIVVRVSAPNPTANVSFVTPLNNQVFRQGEDISVLVSASGGNSEVQRVRLVVDGGFVRQDTTAPYEWGSQSDVRLRNLPVGTHQLRAVAINRDGSRTRSRITIEVVN